MFTASDIAKVLEIVVSGEKNEKEIAEIAEKVGKRFPNKVDVIRRALRRLDEFESSQVTIKSARELLPAEKSSLENNINQRFNREHYFKYEIDKNIKAGLVIKIGDLIIDNSINTKIKQIKEHIVNTAVN